MDLRNLLNAPWLVLLTVGVTLFTSSVLGYWLSSSTRINEDTHHHEHITGLRDGLFVLLGLLLGFTVAMVLPRFDQRTQLVVEEANAIGATILRAEMLPEPQRSRAEELLREYVLVRRDFARQTLVDRPALDRETERTKAIQGQLWQEMVAVAPQNETPVIKAYLKSLVNMIEVAETRLGA
jgi:hypothetical protein